MNDSDYSTARLMDPASMIQRLISGGQTGADSSIVAVGRRLGIPIGGVVPKGWKTELGPNPRLMDLGFVESGSKGYAERTRRNVEQSDATLILATGPDSDGSRLTIAHARRLGKPYLVIDPFEPKAVGAIIEWLDSVRPSVLNVAGNRESKSPGIAKQAEEALCKALRPQALG